ncbi:ABC transporter ATP-binding protein [Dehalococcoidia bacterium]|nr:ABC transporter ATP-binding protein [Dehalococcoidia bacterium]MCL0073332.1 ABC transporter ATP-binding protein [Dehalococcoidia bacterium]MCL0075358.1 ABC transporter ATP-binding protein [Dehalococcoidia bacterium]
MNIIEINNLTKYYGKSRGIIDLNLEVKKGEILGFIGPNGAGKSTTIRLLLNFIFPTSGSAKILGKDIIKHTKEIRRQVGYVPSEVDYYSDLTASEMLQYSSRFYDRSYPEKIADLSDRLELDLDKKKVESLSHGTRKKLAIIQALIHNPELLILDEPTGGLDPLVQKVFFEILKEEQDKGATVFFSSHILTEVQKICDRVAIIKDGTIVKVENIDNLVEDTFKNIRIEFDGNEGIDFDLPGIIQKETSDKIVKLLYNGDINLLLARLSEINLKNLWIEEPSLEEIFMHYYHR